MEKEGVEKTVRHSPQCIIFRMKMFSAISASGEAVSYVDRKRWFWMLSVLFPLQPLITIALHAKTGNEAWLLVLLIGNYVVPPALDALIGVDKNNPPEEVIMALDQDPFYRYLTYAIVPLHFITLVATAMYAATQPLSLWGFTLLALAAGLTAGLAINTAHELGHKNSKHEKLLAKLALAVPAYGHFTIDHNRAHHKLVSTFEDTSSARMGESIYRFAAREIPGAFSGAWRIEAERLSNRGHRVVSRHNAILQSYGLSMAIAVGLIAAGGWKVVPFLLIHHVVAYWQLTSANYIEHYGLLRRRNAEGKPEKCQPHHSWNSNHVFSNLVLFHLQRHSDHHTHPLRRYQSLRHFEALPQLPSGYFGMYLLAYIPWLWFKVMDKRLMQLPHVAGDLDNVNIEPRARAAIFLRWGREKMIEPTYS